MTPLSRNSQKRIKHKENQTKYRKTTRKPRSHVRILICISNVGYSDMTELNNSCVTKQWQTVLTLMTSFAFFFVFMKIINLLTKQKIPVTGGKGKTGSCATPLETASKIAVAKSVLRSFVHLIFNSKQKLKIMIN